MKLLIPKKKRREIAERIGGTVVVKAQIHAGGRGKGGGVKVAKTADDAAEIAGRMLGMNLVTAQTGPEGRRVQKVLVEEGLDIRKELYLGIVIDRQTGKAGLYGIGLRRHGYRRGRCQELLN